MSVFKKCPYSNEKCYFENFSLSIGIPRFNNCKTCTIHRCIIDDDDDLKEDEVKETFITKHKSDSEVIAELKKENTKFKERNAELAGQKASLERWFGEAKEIIRKYYNYNPSCEYSYDDIDKQAELFLKGCKESD